MKIEIWPLGRPRKYVKNPRVVPDSAIEKVCNSIQAFGFRQALVCDEDDVIIIGHTRLMAAERLGFTEVPVHVAVGLTTAQKSGLRIADNRAVKHPSMKVSSKASCSTSRPSTSTSR